MSALSLKADIRQREVAPPLCATSRHIRSLITKAQIDADVNNLVGVV